jgi:hypothetical protein
LPSAGDYTINDYSLEEWAIMENAGAVFLPRNGYRDTDNGYMYRYDSYGGIYYWTNNGYGTARGYSVRLIQNY